MSRSGQEEEVEHNEKLSGVTRYNRYLQQNEVLTLHYLGLPYLVVTRQPLLCLKIPLSTPNYRDGTADGIALQVIFSCPINYPLQIPRVELAELRNVSKELEQTLLAEIADTLEHHLCLYMIVPVVTRVQMLLNNELRHSPQQQH